MRKRSSIFLSLFLLLSVCTVPVFAQLPEEEEDVPVAQVKATFTKWLQFPTERGEDQVVHTLAFSGKGSGAVLATGGSDGIVRTWRCKDGRLLKEMDGSLNYVGDLEFDKSGKSIIAGGYDFTVKIFKTGSGKLDKQFGDHEHIIKSVSMHPGSDYLASGSKDGNVIIRNPRKGEIKTVISPGGGVPVNYVEFSPDGRWMATATARAEGAQAFDPTLSNLISIWDVNSWKEVARIVSDDAELAVFSPDSRLLATTELTRISLREVPSGKIVVKIRSSDSFSLMNTAAFHPSGRVIATGDDEGLVSIWDVSNGGQIMSVTEHDGMVMSIAFNEDGTYMASCDDIGTVTIWKVDVEKEKKK